MAQFDFIECAVNGYRFFWREKPLIARLALPALAIKLTSFMLIYGFALQEEYLTQGLVLIPASFAEGLLIAMLIRMEMFQEPPLAPGKDGAADNRKNLILAAAIGYTLIKMAVALAASFILAQGLAQLPAEGQEPSAEEMQQSLVSLLIGLGGFVFMLWSFRLAWLYVPMAMDVPLLHYLKEIRVFPHSMMLLGIWLVCALPVMLGAIIATQIVVGLISAAGLTNPGLLEYVSILANAVAELVVAIISSIAIAYAVYTQTLSKRDNTSNTGKS